MIAVKVEHAAEGFVVALLAAFNRLSLNAFCKDCVQKVGFLFRVFYRQLSGEDQKGSRALAPNGITVAEGILLARPRSHNEAHMTEQSPLNNVVIHCKGLLFDSDGRLLPVRQAESVGTYWNAPGGRMDEGDSLESCLEREIREETGLIVEAARLAYSHTFVSPGYTDIYMGFHVSRYSGTLGVGTSLTESEQVEITGMQFTPLNEPLSDPIFPPKLWDVAKKCHQGGFSGVEYLGTESMASYGL